MWTMCCFYRVAPRKDLGLQRQTDREERKTGEREDDSETDWLRTTDATRKEEKIETQTYKQICKWSSYVPSGAKADGGFLFIFLWPLQSFSPSSFADPEPSLASSQRCVEWLDLDLNVNEAEALFFFWSFFLTRWHPPPPFPISRRRRSRALEVCGKKIKRSKKKQEPQTSSRFRGPFRAVGGWHGRRRDGNVKSAIHQSEFKFVSFVSFCSFLSEALRVRWPLNSSTSSAINSVSLCVFINAGRRQHSNGLLTKSLGFL